MAAISFQDTSMSVSYTHLDVYKRQTPDLATFLILQYDEIAAIYRTLEQTERAQAAAMRADELCTALCLSLIHI